jgi:hypothetical protein
MAHKSFGRSARFRRGAFGRTQSRCGSIELNNGAIQGRQIGARQNSTTTASFLAFLGVSILIIATPGPDTALTVRNALLGGRAGGVFTALGVAIGQTVWLLATSAGTVALPSRSARGPRRLAIRRHIRSRTSC